jgi:hypothetical protein
MVISILGQLLNPLTGRYIISGSVNEQNNWQSYLLEIDTAGNPVWEKRFRLNNENTSGGFLEKLANGYLLGGKIDDNVTVKPYFCKN